MSEERFVVGSNEIGEIIVTDVETGNVYPYGTIYKFFGLIRLLNEQQATITSLKDENLYNNFKLKSVDDLKKLKDIFEICMILIDGAITDEDLELGYESVFQFERRIKKFNGDLNE